MSLIAQSIPGVLIQWQDVMILLFTNQGHKQEPSKATNWELDGIFQEQHVLAQFFIQRNRRISHWIRKQTT